MDSSTLFSLMTWTLLTLATTVVGLIIYFVRRTVSQLESLNTLVSGPGKDSHEKRLSALEIWKEFFHGKTSGDDE